MVTRNHNGLICLRNRPFPASRVRSLRIIPPVISTNTRVRTQEWMETSLNTNPESLKLLSRYSAQDQDCLAYWNLDTSAALITLHARRYEEAGISSKALKVPYRIFRHHGPGRSDADMNKWATANQGICRSRLPLPSASMFFVCPCHPSSRRHRSFAQHPPPCRSGAVSFPLSDIRIISELPKYFTVFRTSHRSRHLPSRTSIDPWLRRQLT
jgi:hypothetical protein